MATGTVFDEHAEEYDHWFSENKQIYRAEVKALQFLIPDAGSGVEIGVGTGRFSTPFGIRIGVEPSWNMSKIASSRKIAVCLSVGEHLPFCESQFDFALLVTVVCFVKDVARMIREVGRAIKVGGKMIIGFIDKDSSLGQVYESRKDQNKFYKEAHFYSVPEIIAFLRQVGFGQMQFRQTIMGFPNSSETAYQVHEGYGEGAFVVISATKFKSEM